MKRKLDPDLVRVQFVNDRTVPHEEHWVFLKTFPKSGDCKATGIGPMEIEELTETEADKKALKQQIRETELALSAHAGVEAAVDPQIILTKDCFGFKGAVRLLIYTDRPVA